MLAEIKLKRCIPFNRSQPVRFCLFVKQGKPGISPQAVAFFDVHPTTITHNRSLSAPANTPRWKFQEFFGGGFECLGQLSNDLDANVKCALLKLAEIATAYASVICKVIL